MFKTRGFLMVMVLALLMPILAVKANYNTTIWGPGDRLYFSSVAPKEDGSKGISIDFSANTYLHSYIKDVASLQVTMQPGSEIHLKSMDNKLFETNIDIVDTVCHDGYSTFDYSTPSTTVTFIITLNDGENCEKTTIAKDDSTIPEGIDVEGLDDISEDGLDALLDQESITHFILGNVIESITVESVGSSQAIISLSTPANKNIHLKMHHSKNIDSDADGYRDLQVELKSTAGGKADVALTKMKVIKLPGVLPGSLIKIAGSSAVYYYGADSQRYVFPNEKVFYSWYKNFDKVTTISDDEMSKLPIAGLVTYRPGVKLVTFTTTKDVYAVTKGGILKKLKDEQMAQSLYGDDWNKLVDDIDDAFFTSYDFGDDLIELTEFDKETEETLTPNIEVDKEI